ncbi:MAG: 16S rRNA (guanine(527)-N(7))-methyltransferase RsmG [Acidobacteriota bacterium]|nr:16S rRNA (guanine(527)-N(7))-methyltransferase RsmG [Acidobacteriota bacterium]
MIGRDFQGRLRRRAQKAGVTLSADVSSRLEAYYELLDRWNQKINLTALTLASGDEAIDRLLVEPLVAARSVQPGDTTLIDIGSGGGSPALPLAIAAPGLSLTMVEVKVRKSAFLREAVRVLGLDARVLTSRYEALLADPAMHEFASLLSLRAVRVDAKTLLGIQAFVRPGGRMLLFRPSGSTGEIDAPPPLATVESIPLVESLRSQLVILRKDQVGMRR